MFSHVFSVSDSKESTATLELKGSLTIDSCNELRDALLEALGKIKNLVIDVGRVEAIDITGMQLLCAAHRSALLNYKHLSLAVNRSAEFLSQTSDAGFHSSLTNTCMKMEGQACMWAASESACNGRAL